MSALPLLPRCCICGQLCSSLPLSPATDDQLKTGCMLRSQSQAPIISRDAPATYFCSSAFCSSASPSTIRLTPGWSNDLFLQGLSMLGLLNRKEEMYRLAKQVAPTLSFPLEEAASASSASASSTSSASSALSDVIGPAIFSSAPVLRGHNSFDHHPPARCNIIVATWKESDSFPVILGDRLDPHDAQLGHDSSDLFLRGVAELLEDNPLLAEAHKVTITKKKELTADQSIGDFALQQLHTLLHLHRLQQQSAAPTDLQISFVDHPVISTMLKQFISKKLKKPTPIAAKTKHHWTPLTFRPFHSDEYACSGHLAPPRPSSFSPAASSSSSSLPKKTGNSRMSVRYCSTMEEVALGYPLRVIFLPSLMWYYEDGGDASLRQGMQKILNWFAEQQKQQKPPLLFPPTNWDDMVEHKDMIYHRFKSYMRPTSWILAPSVPIPQAIKSVTQSLLAGVAGISGKYWIKGSFSFAGLSVSPITLNNGKCETLSKKVEDLIRNHHQVCVGLQANVHGFTEQELRHWFIAMPFHDEPDSPMKWRHCLTIKTSWINGTVKASVAAPLHADTVACHDLAHRMINDPQHAGFFQELLRMGIHGLRIDCGYDTLEKSAFFNEFAIAPDASMWTQTHLHDLVWRIGDQMATQIWKML